MMSERVYDTSIYTLNVYYISYPIYIDISFGHKGNKEKEEEEEEKKQQMGRQSEFLPYYHDMPWHGTSRYNCLHLQIT